MVFAHCDYCLRDNCLWPGPLAATTGALIFSTVSSQVESGDYLIGQQVIIRGTVTGSQSQVYLTRQETERSLVFRLP